MAYQPIVRWSERRILAYEALLRTRDPVLPHPGAMLDAAQSLGRIHELGRTVRAQVAHTVPSLPGAELVFINLHPLELTDDDLYSTKAPLSSHAGRVVLEITERASLPELADTAERLATLRSMGFRIAVDDLGSGYAGCPDLYTERPSGAMS